MSIRSTADRAAPSAGAFERATGLAGGVARSGWRLSVMPALALPQSLRQPLLDGLRWWLTLAPCPLVGGADGFRAELDDLEGRVARREDLGRRLRRERRRAERGG